MSQLLCFEKKKKQQQVQRGIWLCQHDIPGGHTQALQGFPSSTLGGFQFKKNMRSHLRKSSGHFNFLFSLFHLFIHNICNIKTLTYVI